jgi:hypothetical protein
VTPVAAGTDDSKSMFPYFGIRKCGFLISQREPTPVESEGRGVSAAADDAESQFSIFKLVIRKS